MFELAKAYLASLVRKEYEEWDALVHYSWLDCAHEVASGWSDGGDAYVIMLLTVDGKKRRAEFRGNEACELQKLGTLASSEKETREKYRERLDAEIDAIERRTGASLE